MYRYGLMPCAKLIILVANSNFYLKIAARALLKDGSIANAAPARPRVFIKPRRLKSLFCENQMYFCRYPEELM